MSKVRPIDASRFKRMIRQMIREEIEDMRVHKLCGVVDCISTANGKTFADVFLNGGMPKFQDSFSTFGSWTTVAGSFSVSGSAAASSAAAEDLAIATGSNYDDLTFICQVNIPSISASSEVEIIVRYLDASNYYALVFANNVLLLRKTVGGVATTIASTAVSFTTGWYWFRLQAQGSRLTGWASTSGVPGSWTNQIQQNDTAFSTGAVGIRDVSIAAQFKSPAVYTGVTPAIPVRPGVGPSLGIGQEVFVERINFNSMDLLVDMPRVI